MKKLFYLVMLGIMCSCEKDLSLEGALPPSLPEPQPVDTTPVYLLTAFYSDKPLDFDPNDGSNVKETDLWKYVQDYVKDDYHILRNDTTVEVVQNDIKMPGVSSDTIVAKYRKGTDENGEYLVYLTPDYKNAKYRLYEWSHDHFVIGVRWKDGARVFSRFERIK